MDKILELKKAKFISAVKKAANYLGVCPPTVVFNEDCPGFDRYRTAHIHLEEYTICVSETYLKSLSFEEIENTATHEVAHLMELRHNERFRKAHSKIKKAYGNHQEVLLW